MRRVIALLGALVIAAGAQAQSTGNSPAYVSPTTPGSIPLTSLKAQAPGTIVSNNTTGSASPLANTSVPYQALLDALNLGSTVNIFGSQTGQQMEITIGSTGTPNVQNGPSIKLSNTEGYTSACGSLSVVSNECNSTLVVQTTNTSSDVMQVVSIYGVAESNSAGPGAIGLYGIGVENTGGTLGIGTGAYLQGTAFQITNGKALGAEIRVDNESTSNCHSTYTGIGNCDDIWLTAQSNASAATNLSSAVHVGTAGTTNGFAEGVTLNNGAVANIGFNDQSSATTSFESAGTHTYAVISGPTAGAWGIGTLTPSGTFDLEAGTAAASTSGANVTFNAQNAGSGAAENGGNIYLNPGALTGTGADGNVIVQAQGTAGTSILEVEANGVANGAQITFANSSNAAKWFIGDSASATPSFLIYDEVGGRDIIIAAPNGTLGIMTTSGGLSLGSTTASLTLGADPLSPGSGTNTVINSAPALTGTNDTAYGYDALVAETSGSNNTAVGYFAGKTQNGEGYNTFMGANAGEADSTGNHNAIFGGSSTAPVLATGSADTIIGYNCEPQSPLTSSTSNYIALCGGGVPMWYATGAGTPATGTSMIHGAVLHPDLATSSVGTTGTVCWTTSTGNLTVDTTTTCLLSDGRLKMNIEPLDVGIDEVMQLKPVSYDLKPEVNPTHLGRQVGLVAQDVIKVDPRLASVYQSGPNEGTPSGVRYEQMVALLVKGIQEQQHEIDDLKAQVKMLTH